MWSPQAAGSCQWVRNNTVLDVSHCDCLYFTWSCFISSCLSSLHCSCELLPPTIPLSTPALCLSIREPAALISWCWTRLISCGNRRPHLIKWLEANGFSGGGARLCWCHHQTERLSERARETKTMSTSGNTNLFWIHMEIDVLMLLDSTAQRRLEAKVFTVRAHLMLFVEIPANQIWSASAAEMYLQTSFHIFRLSFYLFRMSFHGLKGFSWGQHSSWDSSLCDTEGKLLKHSQPTISFSSHRAWDIRWKCQSVLKTLKTTKVKCYERMILLIHHHPPHWETKINIRLHEGWSSEWTRPLNWLRSGRAGRTPAGAFDMQTSQEEEHEEPRSNSKQQDSPHTNW